MSLVVSYQITIRSNILKIISLEKFEVKIIKTKNKNIIQYIIYVSKITMTL
jgi:hypothetical protein